MLVKTGAGGLRLTTGMTNTTGVTSVLPLSGCAFLGRVRNSLSHTFLIQGRVGTMMCVIQCCFENYICPMHKIKAQ